MMQQLLEITIVSNFMKTPKACENTLGSSLSSNDYAIKTLKGGQYDLKFILIIVYNYYETLYIYITFKWKPK